MIENEEMAPDAGLIAEAQQPAPPAEPEEEPGAEPEMEEGGDAGGVLTQAKQQVEAHVPPQYKSAVERLVLAGMKVMFDENSHEIAMQSLQDIEGDAPEAKIAVGIAALMSQLTSRVKGQLPQPAIVPAAFILLIEALEFFEESGQIEATPDLLSSATQDLSGYLMQKFGMTPDKVAEAQQVMIGASAEPEQEMGGPMPPEAPGGIVNQAMRG
jgi:hypothetical protein